MNNQRPMQEKHQKPTPDADLFTAKDRFISHMTGNHRIILMEGGKVDAEELLTKHCKSIQQLQVITGTITLHNYTINSVYMCNALCKSHFSIS